MKLRIFLLVHEKIVAMISSVKNSSNPARGVGVTLAFGFIFIIHFITFNSLYLNKSKT
jgi:hypothetical protein